MLSFYPEVRKTDPSFVYLDWLREFVADVDRITDNLGKRTTKLQREIGVMRIMAELNNSRDELGKRIEQKSRDSPYLIIGMGTFVAVIASVVIGEFGRWVWTAIERLWG